MAENNKLETPGVIAGIVALILGLMIFLAGILSLTYFVEAGQTLWSGFLFFVLIFTIISYFLIKKFIDIFLFKKILLVYKSIRSKRTADKEDINPEESLDLHQVRREVSRWNAERSREINELKEREKFRREFIGNISHELKTPIFNIQGYLLTLLDGAINDPEINEKFIIRANKSVERMIAIIKDMEYITQLESGVLNLKMAHYDILTQTRDIFEQLEEKAKEVGVKMRIRKSFDNIITVYADPKRMEQVFLNLVQNAIKYSSKKDPYVEVSFYDMHKEVMIEVADNGLGIPQDDLPRIFERFYRVDKSRTRHAGGSGLGLAIVKHIIEAHGQQINVRSSEGIGSSFSFTLKKGK